LSQSSTYLKPKLRILSAPNSVHKLRQTSYIEFLTLLNEELENKFVSPAFAFCIFCNSYSDYE